jgi:hypothetical protein
MYLINPIQTHKAVRESLWGLRESPNKEVLEALRMYRRARIFSWWRKLWARIRGRDNRLANFSHKINGKAVCGWCYTGLQNINIDQIIGTEGHNNQFDKGFFPTYSSSKMQWVWEVMKVKLGVMNQPVELVEIGSVYFIQSGIYQVSVARALGLETVRAYIVKLETTEKPEYSWMKDQVPVSLKQSAEKFGWDKIQRRCLVSKPTGSQRMKDNRTRTAKGVSSRVGSIQSEGTSSVL